MNHSRGVSLLLLAAGRKAWKECRQPAPHLVGTRAPQTPGHPEGTRASRLPRGESAAERTAVREPVRLTPPWSGVLPSSTDSYRRLYRPEPVGLPVTASSQDG